MGFFRNLWDEALTGSTSESGVGKFRRYNSLLSRSNNNNNNNPSTGDTTPVSRSITILRTNSISSGSGSDSTPSSPSGSSSAGSPFSATSPDGEIKKLTRRKSSGGAHRRETKSPTGYDWIVLTSLDR